MRLPIRTFWLLNSNIERISAQGDLRQLSLVLNSQAQRQEDLNRFRDTLVLELDEPWKFDPLDAQRDEKGFEKLRAMANRR